ncbi:MAG: glycosyltransferase family 2 protein [Pseudomonadota bacterium]
MRPDQPLVSVVIPCFNAERWIGAAIESVRAQTWPSVELVIVNDGSTDNSLDEIHRVKTARTIVVDQRNRGQTAALNAGLSRCSGRFIQYMDADDALAPAKIERQMNRLREAGQAVATARWEVLPTAATVPAGDPPACDAATDAAAPQDWLVDNWRDGGGMMFPAMWLAPRSVVDRAGPWSEDLTLGNDTEYFTRLVLAADAIIQCPDAVCYYRKGHTSMSGLKTDAAWRSAFRSIERSTGRLLQVENSDRTRRATSFVWQRFANACYPYARTLGIEAERRAKDLHGDRLRLSGGAAYNFVTAVFGWKAARALQVMLGRH